MPPVRGARAMSRRSKRRHRQQKERSQGARPERPGAPAQSPKSGTKGRALWIGGAVVVAGAVLYAVSGGGGRKGEIGASSVTNVAAAATSAPAPALLSAAASVPAAVSVSGPKIQFAAPIYNFGKVKSGDLVKHTFVFTNVGGATLVVSNVQASCGCTTAGEWTRQVEPGTTGSIPIQFNSANFGGQVGKAITVTCNDTNQPSVVLQVTGQVWKPIDVTPQFAMLNMTSETASNATVVRIVNNEEALLTLSAPESSNPAFRAELTTNQAGKEFQLIVKTVAPLPVGQAQGQITLKTSSTNVPVINVTAWANVRPAVTVVPAQITLPAIRLGNLTPSTVSVRNDGTNALALREAAVNAKGVDVQVKEIEPGRSFTLAVGFPAGFEIPQGEKVELSVKSNHPQYPEIKVPVVQAPRPGAVFEGLGIPAGVSPSGQ